MIADTVCCLLTPGPCRLCEGWDHEVADAGGARAMAHERHTARVSAEQGDVAPDPVQRRDLVVQSEVTRHEVTYTGLQEPCVQTRFVKKAKR